MIIMNDDNDEPYGNESQRTKMGLLETIRHDSAYPVLRLILNFFHFANVLSVLAVTFFSVRETQSFTHNLVVIICGHLVLFVGIALIEAARMWVDYVDISLDAYQKTTQL